MRHLALASLLSLFALLAGCGDDDTTSPAGGVSFGAWMRYALTAAEFRPSLLLQSGTVTVLSETELAAYDVPYPSRIYMAGIRIFPSLVREAPGLNIEAWANLQASPRPFLTLWGAQDPLLGDESSQNALAANIAGAVGQPHHRFDDASHFLQEDAGEEIARRMVELIAENPL
jgi:haloalkane dehalogenase